MAYKALNYSQLTEEDAVETIRRSVRRWIAEVIQEELRTRYGIDPECGEEELSIFQAELFCEYQKSGCANDKWMSYLRGRYIPEEFRKPDYLFSVRKSDGTLIVWEDTGESEEDFWQHRVEGVGQEMLDELQRAFYETDFKFDHMSFILAVFTKEEDRQLVETARKELEEAAVRQYIMAGELESMVNFQFPYSMYDWNINFYEKKMYSGQFEERMRADRIQAGGNDGII